MLKYTNCWQYNEGERELKCLLVLTSDKLSALDNMSMWVVNSDFERCNKRGQEKKQVQQIKLIKTTFHGKITSNSVVNMNKSLKNRKEYCIKCIVSEAKVNVTKVE